MSFYREWGFSDSPFSYRPLDGNEVGKSLLVGRDEEKRKLKIRLRETNKICTVEGNIGIGKTSLVNVVIFECFDDYLTDRTIPALIPCKEVFQLKEDLDIDKFKKSILFALAQTIIKYKDVLNENKVYKGQEIEKFFKPEHVDSISAGLSILGCGGDGSRSISLNTTKIFEDEAFYRMIEDVLQETFSDVQEGGIVCLIDNIELVNTHVRAKELIELMRDKVFSIPGTKWVLCGEQDIFLSAIESNRMSAYIHKPILIDKLSESVATVMFQTRYDYYNGEYLPCTERELESLFRIFNGVTRDIFDSIDDYCLSVFESDNYPRDDIQKEERFTQWLNKETINYIKSAINTMSPQSFRLLFALCKLKKLEIEYFIKKYERFGEFMDEFLSKVRSSHFIKVHEDGTFIFLRKGYIMRYYFETFDNFQELATDLEIAHDISLKRVK
jgi:hypothetical protein